MIRAILILVLMYYLWKLCKITGLLNVLGKAKVRVSTVSNKNTVCLSQAQREMFVKAILDDSLLVLDRIYDELLNTGESVVEGIEFIGANEPREFKVRYGTKEWMSAWQVMLAERFSCECAAKGETFYLKGKLN